MSETPDPVTQAEEVLARELAGMQTDSVMRDAHLLLMTALVDDKKALAFFLSNLSSAGRVYFVSTVCTSVWISYAMALHLLTSERSVKGVVISVVHDNEGDEPFATSHRLAEKIMSGKQGMREAVTELADVVENRTATEYGPTVVHIVQIAGDLLTQAFETTGEFFKEG